MSSCLKNIQFACAVCRVVFCSLCQRRKSAAAMESFEVICIGLTGAGKTTLLNLLTKQSMDDVAPTTGFMIKACQVDDCILNVKEIGGASGMIQYWRHYYRASQAVVFVLDSASGAEELELASSALHDALKNPDLDAVPCLVLANCQDKPGARNENQLREAMRLESACSGRKWKLVLCNWKDYDAIYSGFSNLYSMLKMPANAV